MSQYVFCEINPNALTTILSPLSFRYVALTFNTGIYSDYISLSWYTCSKVVTVWVLGSLLTTDDRMTDLCVFIPLLYPQVQHPGQGDEVGVQPDRGGGDRHYSGEPPKLSQP